MSAAQRVYLMIHPDRSDAVELAQELIDVLLGGGSEVQLGVADAELVGRPELGVDAFGTDGGVTLAVSLGGDGTMLRTFELAAAHATPVLGVNVGHLGYLTEFEPSEAVQAVRDALAGRLPIEDRMQVEVSVQRTDGTVEGPWCGLNEAVLEKSAKGHTVRLHVDFDGVPFTTYSADGLIVATPTGSTAYNLSARGPIVAPDHRSIQLTPVSPHMLFDRTLVLGPETEIRLEVLGHRPATLSVDGRATAELFGGDSLTATAAGVDARLVTSGRRDFHQVLKSKFGLRDS